MRCLSVGRLLSNGGVIKTVPDHEKKYHRGGNGAQGGSGSIGRPVKTILGRTQYRREDRRSQLHTAGKRGIPG